MAIDANGVNLVGFGYQTSEDISASTLTLDAADSGKVLNFTADCTVTLPSTAVGLSYTLRVGADNVTLAVSPAAADQIIGVDITAADNKDVIFTDQPIGSFIKLFGDGASGWYVQGVHGAFTREA